VAVHKTSRQHRCRGLSPADCGDRQTDDCSEIVQDESLRRLDVRVSEDEKHDRKVKPEDERKNYCQNSMVRVPQPSDAMPKH
jgi:hypothetical protein